MELVCPSCETRFNVPDNALGENGRSVRCSVCSHVWHAQPRLELVPDDTDVSDDIGQSDETAYADSQEAKTESTYDFEDPNVPAWDRRLPPSAYVVPYRRPSWGWVIVGLVIILAVAATYVLRHEIVNIDQRIKPIFKLAGIPVPQASDGLVLQSVGGELTTANGQEVLNVYGLIQNTTEVERSIPPINIAILDKNKVLLAIVTRAPPAPGNLAPKATQSFNYEIPKPPGSDSGIEISVRFSEASN